jgi:hypothetical protein
MRNSMAAIVLAATLWGCDAKAEQTTVQAKAESSYTATVKIDDV